MPSAVLEVVVGLVFVFFLFSMLCSGINELISRQMGKRADFLTLGVWRLLEHSGATPEDRAKYFKLFWAHPLVRQLGQPVQDPAGPATPATQRAWRRVWKKLCGWVRWIFTTKKMRSAMKAMPLEPRELEEGRRLRPSYIPAEVFATVVMSFMHDTQNTDLPKPVTHDSSSRPAVPEGSTLAAALEAFAVEAGDDVQRMRVNLQRWYDAQMERVSGWYKRESKRMLLYLGAIVVLALNVDTIVIARTLWSDPSARRVVTAAADLQLSAVTTTTAVPGRGTTTTVATEAEPAAPTPEIVCVEPGAPGAAHTVPAGDEERNVVSNALDCVKSLPLPVGWRLPHNCGPDNDERCPLDDSVRAGLRGAGYWGSLLKLVGWALTIGALTFGAPFWFDLLNRFGSLRGAGAKPRATSES